MVEKNEKLSLQALTELIGSSVTYFERKKNKGERNIKYKRGDHWSAKEKSVIESQNRRPYSMSLIAHKLGIILSTQRNNRTSFSCVALNETVHKDDADSLSVLLREKERGYNLKYLESEVFEAGLSVNFGGVELVVESGFGGNRVGLKKLDARNFIWDMNAKEYDLSDALFMTKIEKVYRDFAIAEYGSGYFEQPGEKSHSFSDQVTVYTHYQRVIRREYIVVGLWGKNEVKSFKFKSKQEAELQLESIKSESKTGRKNGSNDESSDVANLRIIEKKGAGIDKYIFADNAMISYEQTELQNFPFAIYRAFHFENEYWTLTDLLIDPQLFLDRVFMQIDYGFGRDVKNVFQANINVLADNETAESAMYKAEKVGGVIWTRTNEEVFKPVRYQGVNPQYFQVAQVMQRFLEDISGGRSFQGLSEFSNESGKAINAKLQQGMLVAGLFIDNLQRWKRDLGKKLFSMILKYESTDTLNLKTNFDLLYDNIDIQVSDITLNMKERTENLNQLLTINSIYPGAVPLEVMLSYTNIDATIKDKILKSYSEMPKNEGNGDKEGIKV